MSREKRQSERYAIRILATLQWGSRHFHGSTRNLSRGGTFVELNAHENFGEMLAMVGEEVILSLKTVHHEGPLRLLAYVRWTDTEVGLGMEFGRVEPDALLTLEKVLGEAAQSQ